MHRMLCLFAKTRWFLALAAVALPAASLTPTARGDLLRTDGAQAFPDLAGDNLGQMSYAFNPGTGTGTFSVTNAPSDLALGPQLSNEVYVYDPSGQSRNETIQVKLDSNGNLVNDPSNSFSVYGSVTINGQKYDGLLLQGTPTAFGWAPTNPKAAAGTGSTYDMYVNITGGQLAPLYGSKAYVPVYSEFSTFNGSFAANFSGQKAWTNVMPYATLSPTPLPEPSTFAILLACSGAGLLYHQRRRIDVADLGVDE